MGVGVGTGVGAGVAGASVAAGTGTAVGAGASCFFAQADRYQCDHHNKEYKCDDTSDGRFYPSVLHLRPSLKK